MKKLVTLILALAMTATTALSVFAADPSTVTKGTLLSEEEVAAVKANSEKIAMDAGTMTLENVKNLFGDNPTSGGEDKKYSLFDDETGAESPTRFALDQDSADSPVVLTWSIADTSKPAVPGYLVLTTGKNSSTWVDRRATEFKFYGAAADGKWVELAAGGEMMEAVDSYSYGIKLVDTAAFTQYKFEFKCPLDKDGNRAFQLDDLSVYVADPTEGGNTEAGNTEAGKTEAGKTESGKTEPAAPKTGSASVVIATVAVVALAGVVVATKKREQD